MPAEMKKRIIINLFFLFFCSSLFLYAQNGIVKSYYGDGAVQTEASYVNDVLDGAYRTFYPDGKLKLEKNYSQGILDGYVREYYPSALLKEEYFVKLGVKEGAHRIFFEDGQLRKLLTYSEGKLTNRQIFDSQGEKQQKPTELAALIKKEEPAPPASKNIEKAAEAVPMAKENPGKAEIITAEKTDNELKKETETPQDQTKPQRRKVLQIPAVEEDILCDAQLCPVPIGGMKGIYKKLVYPQEAIQAGLEGVVSMIATISDKGEVGKIQFLKKLGMGCDEAAQEALRKTRFIPAETNDKDVETNATINIFFKLAEPE